MRNYRHLIFMAILLLVLFAATNILQAAAIENSDGHYTYLTYENDPLNARIYTLDNGLTVYMTVYKNEPRVQTAIPVKAGSKMDPADATGLAHYLEHMMFKGSVDYGTMDYDKEKVELSKIIDLYEQRYHTTDSAERANIYKQIDSISGVAATYAIANEYDKMINSLGAQGTNAFTSVEQTVYINNIPSNQLEKWLTIEASRFAHPVMRLFHTELEVVYEEKNRGLDNDRWKVEETMYEELFKKHPYGTQTTIGSIEHLKNPSLKKVIDYYNTYYVPNNMAICLSGDFNPDSVIRIIDNKFGSFPAKEIPQFISPVEDPIKQPVEREVLGPDAENVRLGFRFGGELTTDVDYMRVMDMILSNSVAGIMDLNLVQKQKVLGAGSYTDVMNDYSIHVFYGRPREGQTIEEVKDLLLSQIELIKKGEFPEWLVDAAIKDMRLSKIRSLESNWARSFSFVQSFISGMDYQDYINRLDRYSKITRQDIIDFANKNYGNNYVVVYKRTGEDKNVKKVIKPPITPVDLNRDARSQFAGKIIDGEASPINPVFLDYQNLIKQRVAKKSLPIYYLKNDENDIFQLYYILDMGNDNNNKLGTALSYSRFLGTSRYTPEQFKQELYKAGCSFSVSTSNDQLWVSLSGLKEDFETGIVLLEELLRDAQPNEEALDNLVADILKARQDNKLSKRNIFNRAMRNYGIYGPHSSFTNILSEEELKALTAEELIDLIKSISGYQHRILYYGPHSTDEITSLIDQYHYLPDKFAVVPDKTEFEQLPTDENKVYVTNYDMKQVEIYLLSKSEPYNPNNAAVRRLFNEYYGGGMSSIVFTTLRESKALAYSTYSSYTTPYRPEDAHYVVSYIGTQVDKLGEAMAGMLELLNNMPESDNLFALSKEATLKQIQTERITKSGILFNYEQAREMGRDHDARKDVYDNVPLLDFTDVKNFQSKYLKDKNYTILVMGDTTQIDYDILRQYAEPQYLTLEELFGY